ncbi:thioesterase [Sneathiella sp. P13V-1]|uniref:acyl-CoA thioesterase n=1 Tax=Sneathiella sp. P13V-1 TaxID=2697366 RepID=UPI00187B4D54|nr:thioesterase family protein [Sneathiella sp. P13V-1]MBE7635379.1 thioesterase [Sneathiella sp. P13V-1]
MSRYHETYRGHVQASQLDLIGHMNIQYYHTTISLAMQNIFRLLGHTPDMFKNEGKGFAAVEQHCRYKSELLAGDIIHMMSGLKDFTSKSITIHHQLFNSSTGEVSFDCEMTVLHFDMKNRKVTSFSEDQLSHLESMKLNEGEA